MATLTPEEIAHVRYLAQDVMRRHGVDTVAGIDDTDLIDVTGNRYDLAEVLRTCERHQPHEWPDVVADFLTSEVVPDAWPFDDAADGWAMVPEAAAAVTAPQNMSWSELSDRLRSRVQTTGWMDQYASTVEQYVADAAADDVTTHPGDSTFRYARRLAPGLIEVMYLDYPETVVPLSDALLVPDQLVQMWEAARRNTALEPVAAAQWHPALGDGADYLTVGGDSLFTASKLADVETLAGSLGLDSGRTLIFAAPSAYELLCHPLDSLDVAANALARMCAAAWHSYREAGGLTPNLYVWENGRLEVLAIVNGNDSGEPEFYLNVASGLGEALHQLFDERLHDFDASALAEGAAERLIRSRVISETHWRAAQLAGIQRNYAWPVAGGLVEVLAFATPGGDVPFVDEHSVGATMWALRAAGRQNAAAESRIDLEFIDVGTDLGYHTLHATSLADRAAEPRQLLAEIFGDAGPALLAFPYRDLVCVHHYVSDDELDLVIPVLLGAAKHKVFTPVPVSPDVYLWDGEKLCRFAYIDDDGGHVWIPHHSIGKNSLYWSYGR
ncbi:hypothetical protein FR943_14965 [Mycobacterium sp. TNTM28]|uniref:Uncharacterized protein n=1 Tax=[Mycobacterium] fortunisiensis TaxID=2600579 RepID=A0ABS6KNQ4_9MYCO|nr:hypothetical protein [[Mycobacterium] fortunisiensis]MBU9765139.1 hypothetical protein [[Mycobacterium] fortunisiensis]